MTKEYSDYFQDALSEIASALNELRASKAILQKSPMLTTFEASKHLNVSTGLIRKWIFQKKVASYKVGKCVRIKLVDLERCVETRGF